MEVGGFKVARLPLPRRWEEGQEQMVALVERMLDLHQQQPQTPQAKTILKRQIEATGREIDNLVYRLYDLTEDEIRIVEGE